MLYLAAQEKEKENKNSKGCESISEGIGEQVDQRNATSTAGHLGTKNLESEIISE